MLFSSSAASVPNVYSIARGLAATPPIFLVFVCELETLGAGARKLAPPGK